MAHTSKWKTFCQWYERFVTRQGFAVLTVVCVAVITATAVWTRRTDVPRPKPTPPVSDAASAAQLMQQSLQEAATPMPAATPAPLVWSAPLESIAVVRAFDGARLQPSAATGLWSIHDAVDLAAEKGEPVRAMADGVVIGLTDDKVAGQSVTIRHSEGYVIEYGALSMIAALQMDDPVEGGQTIGFAGNTLLDESLEKPHLHLRVCRDDIAMDPELLLREIK